MNIQVHIIDNGTEILLTIDSDIVLVDGAAKTLDCPAEIIGIRTFVPVRFVSETFGASVLWDGETGTITIKR